MESLKDHLLIAMPSLDGSFFERTVIYLCEHDEKGAMGIVINRPIGLGVEGLLEQMGLDNEANALLSEQAQVLIGGPVLPERGFVLHSPEKSWINSEPVSDYCTLTTSRDILTAIGTQDAPSHFKVALGYSGWSKDQLEQELADNTWLTIKANAELVFDLEHDELWTLATKELGFDIWQLSSQTGHA
ncbi:YqgE/AlgH family protein [Shewanella sp. SR44-3]|uniref:YqgE/AlgH family protein n=1 Tax=unclassified Shewanella TaxID=196818 RepID=UPI0015FD8D09|nr:YqgE/AlgH family protein [Shewanella sp. SR44-3]MBB1269277.1 YqgE/AlgH family protein [Shewanella sp. SR44-3]